MSAESGREQSIELIEKQLGGLKMWLSYYRNNRTVVSSLLTDIRLSIEPNR